MERGVEEGSIGRLFAPSTLICHHHHCLRRLQSLHHRHASDDDADFIVFIVVMPQMSPHSLFLLFLVFDTILRHHRFLRRQKLKTLRSLALISHVPMTCNSCLCSLRIAAFSFITSDTGSEDLEDDDGGVIDFGAESRSPFFSFEVFTGSDDGDFKDLICLLRPLLSWSSRSLSSSPFLCSSLF